MFCCLDSCCCSLEGALNFAGYFPAVSSVTGVFRMIIGVIEAVVSVIFTILLCSNHYVSGMIKGVKNVIRGTIETIPIIGNILLIVYDCLC